MFSGLLQLPLRKIRQRRWTVLILILLLCFGLFRYYVNTNNWPVHPIQVRWRESGAYEKNMPWTRVKSDQIPLHVYIVEEHHEVIPYWVDIVKAYGERKANLIHIDAHSDLDYPEALTNFPFGRIPQNDVELSTLMQANDQFIQSAVIAQLINTTYVIYPPWVSNETDVYRATLGLTLQHEQRQICMCFQDQQLQCQTRDWDNPLNNTAIEPAQCKLQWTYNYLELQSERSPDIIRHSKTWSLGRNRLYPLILDIDEDYFGVHLPARNLTDVQLSTYWINQLDEVIQTVFCPQSPHLEAQIDRWFFDLLRYIRNMCARNSDYYFSPPQQRKYCLDNLFRYIYRSLASDSHRSWLCHRDVNTISLKLVHLLTNPELNPTQLDVLEKIGLCLTMAWSTHMYEPRMRLCMGHNQPNHSLVEEYVPNFEQLFALAANLTKILLALPQQPAIITICRSTRDGYTPRWLQPSIEAIVLGLIRRVFNLTPDAVHYSAQVAGGWRGWDRRHEQI